MKRETSMLNRCIRKIQTDKATGIVVAPYWPTQIWFPALLEILIDNPIQIQRKTNLLTLPHTGRAHPLGRKLTLIACHVSGKSSKIEDFQKRLPQYSCRPGNCQPKNSIKFISKNGLSIVQRGKLIQFKRLWKM